MYLMQTLCSSHSPHLQFYAILCTVEVKVILVTLAFLFNPAFLQLSPNIEVLMIPQSVPQVMPVIIYSFFFFIFLSISTAALNSNSPAAIFVCLRLLSCVLPTWALPPPSLLLPAIIFITPVDTSTEPHEVTCAHVLVQCHVLLSSLLPSRGCLSP